MADTGTLPPMGNSHHRKCYSTHWYESNGTLKSPRDTVCSQTKRRLVRKREHLSRGSWYHLVCLEWKKTRLSVVFVESGALQSIDSGHHCEHVLRRVCCLVIKDNVAAITGRYSRTSHTINFLLRENVTFIKPEKWPPNNSGVNAIDYAMVCIARKSLPAAKIYRNGVAQVCNNRWILKSWAALYWLQTSAAHAYKKSLRNRGTHGTCFLNS